MLLVFLLLLLFYKFKTVLNINRYITNRTLKRNTFTIKIRKIGKFFHSINQRQSIKNVSALELYLILSFQKKLFTDKTKMKIREKKYR
jgi:hypothetical protein